MFLVKSTAFIMAQFVHVLMFLVKSSLPYHHRKLQENQNLRKSRDADIVFFLNSREVKKFNRYILKSIFKNKVKFFYILQEINKLLKLK